MSVERLGWFEQLAFSIATQAHLGQVDKSGKDYILHSMRVSSKGKTENEKVVGLLHDVVEDTEVTLDNLRDAGFSEEIVEAVDCISQRKGEAHEEYLARVKGNALAKVVKMYDIEDNSDPARLTYVSAEVRERMVKKYSSARKFLET